MKRKFLFLIMLCLVFVFSLSACTLFEDVTPATETKTENTSDTSEKVSLKFEGVGVKKDEEKMWIVAADCDKSSMESEVIMANGLKVDVTGKITYSETAAPSKKDYATQMNQLNANDMVLADGTVLWSNKDVVLADGTLFTGASAVYLKDGTEVSSSVVMPDGTVTIWADGSITGVEADAIKVPELAEEKYTLKDGTLVEWYGVVVAVTLKDGTLITGQIDPSSGMATVALPSTISISLSDATITFSDGVEIKEGKMKTKDGKLIN